jgi:hypothetical protein
MNQTTRPTVGRIFVIEASCLKVLDALDYCKFGSNLSDPTYQPPPERRRG